MNAPANTRPGVLKADPMPAFQVPVKRTFYVAICEGLNPANPFSWSTTKVDLFLISNDSERLDAAALIEALRGEHDLRDGKSRSAAVKAFGSDADSASYFSFQWVRAGFHINRVGEVGR